MVRYLIMRIRMGMLDYLEVIAKFPQYKDEIDEGISKITND